MANLLLVFRVFECLLLTLLWKFMVDAPYTPSILISRFRGTVKQCPNIVWLSLSMSIQVPG